MNIAFNEDCVDVMRRYPTGYFDLAVVDPPYGDIPKGGYMNGTGGGLAKQKKYGDAIWTMPKPTKQYFDELFRVSKNQIIWGANYFVEEVHRSSPCWLVWDKVHPEGVNYADFEMAYTSFDGAARMFRYRWNGFVQQNMKNKEVRIHPTQKPVALYEWIYTMFTKSGDKILDTHLGSGSSRIAAYNAGLDFTGCEINREYFEQQEERYKAHTAQMRLF
ncbi:MAG: site-specific DNA-methyltransferase [Oscillospiraceae bacterium]|nr:site-specific DNA-methyltransferase [Oscillospiraceae bacterium]